MNALPMNALPINDLPCTSPANNTKQLFRKLKGKKPPNNKTYYITLYLHIHKSEWSLPNTTATSHTPSQTYQTFPKAPRITTTPESQDLITTINGICQHLNVSCHSLHFLHSYCCKTSRKKKLRNPDFVRMYAQSLPPPS